MRFSNSSIVTLSIFVFIVFSTVSSWAGANEDLLAAAYDGNLQEVNACLAKGADINAKGNNGYTALMMAAQDGHSDIISQLLAKGADANIKASNGATALSIASRNGDEEIVKMLKRYGAKE